MRMDNALSSLVGEEIEGDVTWSATLAAPNGSLYGVPCDALQVGKSILLTYHSLTSDLTSVMMTTSGIKVP